MSASLSSLTVQQLRLLARDAQIVGYSALRKDKLIQAIEQAQPPAYSSSAVYVSQPSFTPLTQTRSQSPLPPAYQERKQDKIKEAKSKPRIGAIPIATPTTRSKPEFLLGPVSLTQHASSTFNKLIYVFGNDPSPLPATSLSQECPRGADVNNTQDFARFLYDSLSEMRLSSKDKEIVDVYVELPYIRRGQFRSHQAHARRQDYLGRLSEQFKDCLEVVKSKCPLDNVRFHYTDVSAHEDTDGVLQRLADLEVLLGTIAAKYHTNLAVAYVLEPTAPSLLPTQANLQKDLRAARLLLEDISSRRVRVVSKVDKEISKVHDKHVRAAIELEFLSKFDQAFPNVQQLAKATEETKGRAYDIRSAKGYATLTAAHAGVGAAGAAAAGFAIGALPLIGSALVLGAGIGTGYALSSLTNKAVSYFYPLEQQTPVYSVQSILDLQQNIRVAQFQLKNAYLAARLFRTHDAGQNNIVIANEESCVVLRQLLRDLQFKVLFRNVPLRFFQYRCLDIRKLPLPLFE